MEPSEKAEASEISESSVEAAQEEVGFRQVAIPFGPFLALGAMEVLFWGERLLVWWQSLMGRLILP